jgi:predicted SAM-dependent methyltransferase
VACWKSKSAPGRIHHHDPARRRQGQSSDRGKMITKLQIGTSRLEDLHPQVLKVFLDKSWLHLGDLETRKERLRRYSLQYFLDVFRRHSIIALGRQGIRRLFWERRSARKEHPRMLDLYEQTYFKDYFYRKGDRLPLDDNSIEYIYSEHFFEHLFLDEAIALLKECHRVLKTHGVIRTCVPDADLRTYQPPEPIGFPSQKMSFEESYKHKTRWSVYALAEALELAGFEPVPLRYCDKAGHYICKRPEDFRALYQFCPDQRTIYDLTHIMRIDSLIVDGLKKSG